jgi:hypothetical protein
MKKNIQELFALPTGLKQVANIEGMKLYSSEKLKKAFLLSFSKSGRGKPIYPSIEKMVNSDLITPCYLSKNLYRLFKHKMTGGQNKTIMGFYYLHNKKVYVLIDNNINIFGSASNDLIVSTTMHECMHLCAGRFRSKFISLFKPVLKKFYENAFTGIFKLKSPMNTEKIINFIMRFENSTPKVINKELSNYFRLLEKEMKDITSLNEKEFRKVLTDYIVSIKISMTSFPVFVKVYRKYLHIFGPLHKSYEQTFGKRNKYTTVFQELYAPSEVICVLSEMAPTTSIIKKAFKLMD